MKTFEYKIQPRMIREDELNELGKQRWELVAVHPEGKMFFKREIESSPKLEPRKNLTPSYGIER